MFWSIIY